MKLIAIDGKTKKLSLVTRKRDENSPWIMLEVPISPNSFVTDHSFRSLIEVLHPEVVAYEAPYMNKNAKTFRMLVEVMTRVEGVVRGLGIEWKTVTPGEWQSMLTQRGERNLRRADVKVRSAMLAESICGFRPATEDLCDAACIYDYHKRMDGRK